MVELDCQIREHENKIKDLTAKLEEVYTKDEKLNLNIQIN